MTQPPPPPNQPPNQPPQPPQGGFGPPRDQPPAPPAAPPAAPPSLQKGPQPGYGHPQQPGGEPPQQPQPGYGYPHAPQAPQPPQPPAGHGYPGQPYNPYAQQPPAPGQPPHPYAQPGYGYPGRPTVPMPPQPVPSGGGRNSAAVAIVVSALVAIALIIGGGVWYAKSSGDDGKKQDTAGTAGTDDKGGTGGTTSGGREEVPSNTASKVLFEVPMPKTDDTVVTSGSWLTDTVYAKAGIAEIVGYDPAKGTKLWTIKLPGPVCTASEHVTDNGRTAVVFQPKMPAKNSSAGCSQVAAIDLAAGKKLWTRSVESGDYPVTFQNVTVAQHTVAVGSTDGGAAFDIDTAKALWRPKPGDSCYDAGYGGGTKLVAVRKCGSYDNRQLHIQTIDPRTGKVISEYEMAAGIEYAGIVSTDPLVVAADVGDSAGDGSGISDYFSIDNRTGKLLTRISAPGDEYGGRCDDISRIEDCKEVVAGNGRLYVPTEEHEGSGDYSRTNEIIAFDLATGKQTGQRLEAGDGSTLSPLRMDGTDLLAYKRPPYDKGGQIVSVDGGSFKATTLLQNPATRGVRDAETSMLPDFAEILYAKGRLFMSAVYADKSSYGDDDLVIAFGTDG
ncbi:PQQ-binding-like beta-propeller repeat protein [Streptomyces sp. TG1A-8]|uniref:outer membrane protein assembly factor BamB family protein n=1 Tax=Streptomyces sp. TG1A-8 TaxID=3051385 RepID=UPI00265B9863|nr:PQQ-binding-like beta-propeller repeat protein [Streptomyces sp. TG1A-8]MDO0927323.1 PQQ-binding-like beta-propeller repeat protein [Streptomyces sp. TG1A-8]